MSYELEPGRPLGEELQRVAVEQLEDALALLSDRARKAEERVHEVRKRAKMLRGLFRLMGGRPENRLLRDVGRELSGSRDAAVVWAAFREVAPRGEHEQLRAELKARARAVAGEGGRLEEASARVEPRIHEALASVRAWSDLDGWDFERILKACVRSYHRGRKLLRRARKDATPENVHELRKRVKDHWYHMRLLEALCPIVAASRKADLDELGDLLGSANDLAVLHAAVPDASLRTVIDRKRAKLVQAGLAIGVRLYEPKPGAFADSLRTARLG